MIIVSYIIIIIIIDDNIINSIAVINDYHCCFCHHNFIIKDFHSLCKASSFVSGFTVALFRNKASLAFSACLNNFSAWKSANMEEMEENLHFDIFLYPHYLSA